MAKSKKLVCVPESIELGDRVVKVVWEDFIRSGPNHLYGSYSPTSACITLARDLSLNDVSVMNTLIHEILHGLFDSYALSNDKEEEIVTTLANGLCTLFRHNPELINYIQKVSKA